MLAARMSRQSMALFQGHLATSRQPHSFHYLVSCPALGRKGPPSLFPTTLSQGARQRVCTTTTTTPSGPNSNSSSSILTQEAHTASPTSVVSPTFLNAASLIQETTSHSRSLSASYRTHTCGELRASEAEQTVTLSGWVDTLRPLGPLTFVLLRDRYGVTQCLVDATAFPACDLPRLESVISVTGKVTCRPAAMRKRDNPTGDIELLVSSLVILNATSGVLPIPLNAASVYKAPSEAHRLTHRHLDLRRPRLQANLATRSAVTMAARLFLTARGFLDIETPTLFKITSEGAAEFLVPTRQRGKFYALPQSPQQYKQLLMIGGVDRYFQLAKCFRDEGSRADRQPEFTQIDMEVSFSTQRDIMELMESLMKHLCTLTGRLSQSQCLDAFPQLTYTTCMTKYGSDKPDLRYGLAIDETLLPSEDASVRCMVLPPLVTPLTSSGLKTLLTTMTKSLPPTVKPFVCRGSELRDHKGLANYLSPSTLAYLNAQVSQNHNNLSVSALPDSEKEARNDLASSLVVFLIATSPEVLSTAYTLESFLGHFRSTLFKTLCAPSWPVGWEDALAFCWVTEFPMFEVDESVTSTENPSTSSLVATHHPFTAPMEADLEALTALCQPAGAGFELTPEATRAAACALLAQHFDLVCNGWELGGGSMRLHQQALQLGVLTQVLELPVEKVATFAHLVTGLGQGAPPHGGMALGLDRVVAILCRETSLREVMAFPKSTSGQELMTASPSVAPLAALAPYHITVTPDNEASERL